MIKCRHTDMSHAYYLCGHPSTNPASAPHALVALRRSITGNEYDKKATELKERQLELAMRIEQHQKGEGRVPDNAGKPDFRSFARGCDL